MTISLSELAAGGPVAKVAIRSVDLSLYQADAWINGQSRLIVDSGGKPLRATNIVKMKQQLALLEITELVLVHSSAYDEMIGQPVRGQDEGNELEVPLNPEPQPFPPGSS